MKKDKRCLFCGVIRDCKLSYMLEEPVYLALPSAGFVLQFKDCGTNPALGNNVTSAANQQGRPMKNGEIRYEICCVF